MPFDYLPVFVQKAAPKPARTLVHPSHNAWHPEVPPLASAKIALLTSSAVRTPDQPPFNPPDDATHRAIPAEPHATDLVMDHRSPLGTDPRKDPEVVFPRAALKALAERGVIGGVAKQHYSFLGGTRDHDGVENDLGRGLAGELREQDVNLAVVIPF